MARLHSAARLLPALLFLPSTHVFAQDSTYRGNPAHTGHAPGALGEARPGDATALLYVASHPWNDPSGGGTAPACLIALPPDGGAPAWRKDLAGRPTAPTVADGRVLVGLDSGGVTAFDAGTGEVRWSFATKAGVLAQPVVADGRVYFGGGEDHQLHALRLEDGDELWSKKVPGEGVYSPVSIREGSLFAFSATHHAAPVLLAFSVDGKALWKKNNVELTQVTGPNDVECAGDLVLAGWSPDHWSKRSDRAADGSRQGFAVAFEASSGDERWRTPLGAREALAPTVGGELVAFATRSSFADGPPGSDTLGVVVLRVADGSERWSKSLGPAVARFASTSPVIAGSLLLVATRSEVQALDLESGELRWKQPVRSAVITVAGERVILVAAGGSVSTHDLATGKQRSQTSVEVVKSNGRMPACPGEIAPPCLADHR